MAFMQLNRELAAKAPEGGGSYINQSGIYDVTILAPVVKTNDKGAKSINFYVDYNDNPQMLYTELRLQNNDGSENFGLQTFMQLMAVSGVDAVADEVEATLPIGKDQADKDVMILEDLTDLDVKMRIQMEYSVYNGDIRERKTVKAFYTKDGASAAEVLNGTEEGLQIAKDEKYASNVTYKDGLTEDDVTKWIADGRPSGSFGGGSASTATEAPKRRFGRK